jgi:2-oxoglutarate ferredoxin oxidoreductase subunit gamma
MLKNNGILLINSSLVKENPKRGGIKAVKIEATGIAEGLGNWRIANMVALGAMAKLTGALTLDQIEDILQNFCPPDKQHFIPMNVQAIKAGFSTP